MRRLPCMIADLRGASGSGCVKREVGAGEVLVAGVGEVVLSTDDLEAEGRGGWGRGEGDEGEEGVSAINGFREVVQGRFAKN